MSSYVTPPRAARIAVCPPAPKRITENPRPVFFTPSPILFSDDNSLDVVKIQMVKNYLSYFPSGTFRHSIELSKKVVESLNCKCEQVSEDKCIYTK